MTALAVFGSPIEHSRSPLLHRTAYEMLGLDWEYGLREVREAELAQVIADLDASWRGLSLTMPLKNEALRLSDTADEIALRTGSVNTLRFVSEGSSRRLHGYNTDVAGVTNALRSVGLEAVHRAVIVGAGATASSALVAAAELGAAHVRVLARTPSKAAALTELGHSLGLIVDVSDLADPLAGFESPQLVISTLPGGADLAIDWPDDVRADSTLLDVAYDPWPSPLAAHWHAAGGTVANGLAMLVHQAVVQVRIFVADDPFQELDGEPLIAQRMLAAVGLDERGQPLP